MEFRFKIRTILIATAIVAGYFGLQAHVQNKAERFIEELRDSSGEMVRELKFQVDYASTSPVSFNDVLLLRRRCEVRISKHTESQGGKAEFRWTYRYHVFCFGKSSEPYMTPDHLYFPFAN